MQKKTKLFLSFFSLCVGLFFILFFSFALIILSTNMDSNQMFGSKTARLNACHVYQIDRKSLYMCETWRAHHCRTPLKWKYFWNLAILQIDKQLAHGYTYSKYSQFADTRNWRSNQNHRMQKMFRQHHDSCGYIARVLHQIYLDDRLHWLSLEMWIVGQLDRGLFY